MRIFTLTLLSIFAAPVLCNAFEPANFNITQALIKNGVEVSAIPELAGSVEHFSSKACSLACNSLKVIFGSENVLSGNTTAYNDFTSTYWSAQQAEVRPSCVFKPASALQVSTLILVSRLTQCPFAVKGGGHAAFAGASSIEGGITVALEKLNEVVLSPDKKIASVGPGNRWVDVYKALEEYGVQVTGGRIASVGVPGLILGGGISHFSNMYGWACDNVESYEVVTASGLVVTASATTFPDLYWALRGGGNNFGIVTKFNMRTFPQREMWGGSRLHAASEWDAIYRAFYNVARDAEKDPKQAQFVAFALQNGTKIAGANLEYSDPTPWPPIFNEWKSIPAALDTTAISNLSTLVTELGGGAPDGFKETYWVQSFKLDQDLIKWIIDVFFEMLVGLEDVANLLPVLSIQTITTPAMEKMQQNGGNALGLDPKNGPIFSSNLAMMWTDDADDDRVMSFSNGLMKRLVAEAKSRKLDDDFIYMNYASAYQDPIASYGASSKKRLKSIASKYDPTAVFHRLQPGYFKLDGAPFRTFPG